MPYAVVTDVTSGEDVNLRAMIPAERPILFWFWSPYCGYCAREAPDLEEFAREHRADLTVIGLGTQSDYDEAQDFVTRYGITFRMFWDSGFKSWDGFSVRRQPTSILVSRGGTKIKRWDGALADEQWAEAVRLAREQG